MDTDDGRFIVADPASVFDRERPHLLALAFRILGSEPDAQDMVQEAWLRFARADTGDVRNVSAWLTTVVTRLCLDLLRRKREQPYAPADLPAASDDTRPGGPEDTALLAAELTDAFVVVMAELTPAQRVALVLHDVFGTPFDDVARILDTTPGSAKKLASRARHSIRAVAPRPTTDPRTARRVVAAFLKAVQQGDVDGLVAVLHPDVTRTADPQALRPGVAQYVAGADSVIAETHTFRATARHANLATIDGRPGIAIRSGGRVRAALVVCVEGDRIASYDVVADPHRVALLRIEEVDA